MEQGNRLRLHALTSSALMDKKKYRVKRYIHFDNRVSIDKVKDKIKNPCWVSKHGFYPFIHFEIKFHKYNKKSNTKKRKCGIYTMLHILIVLYISIMETN